MDHAIVFAHSQIVGPRGVRQFNRLVMNQLIGRIDHAIVEIRGLLAKIEKHQILVVFIDFEV